MSLPPNIDNIRLTSSYVHTFALIVQWNVFIVATITLSIFALLIFIREVLVRNIHKKLALFETSSLAISETVQLQMQLPLTKKNSEVVQVQAPSSKIIQQQKKSQTQEIKPLKPLSQIKKPYNFINILLSIILYIFMTLCAYLHVNLYMFGFLGRKLVSDFITIVVIFICFTAPTFVLRKINSQTKSSRRTLIATIRYITLHLLIASLIMIATKDICVCQYNTNYGFNLLQSSRISTGLTRMLTINKVCQKTTLCHIYATLPQETSTSVFLNAHSGLQLTQIHFILKLNSIIIANKTSFQPFKIDNIQYTGQRLVHSVLIDGLLPATLYQVQITKKTGEVLNSTTYRTLPDSQVDNLKLAVGGDVGMTAEGVAMTNHLIAYDPDVIVIGGDLAYDNAIRTCYYSWDNFYDMFETVNRQLNRLIPIVLTIGNHDIGFDALAKVHVSKEDAQIPFYYAYNPQHTTHKGEVPLPRDRLTYHYHKIGPILLLNLDSGYMQTFEGQTSFMQKAIKKYPNSILFANYHNPIYPSCMNPDPQHRDMKVITQGIYHWIPIFDYYNFTVGLEHHTHFQKMTFKMRNNTVNEQSGMRFIGDGSWGVVDEDCPDSQATKRLDIMQQFRHSDPNHMWQLTLTQQNIDDYSLNYTAIDLSGEAFLTKIDKISTSIK